MSQSKKRPSLSYIGQEAEFGSPANKRQTTPNSRNAGAVVPTAGLLRPQPPLLEVSFPENVSNNTHKVNAAVGYAALLRELEETTQKPQNGGSEKEAVTEKPLKRQAIVDIPNVEIFCEEDTLDEDYTGNTLLLDWINKMEPAFAFEKSLSDRRAYAEQTVDQLRSQHNARFLRFKKSDSKEPNNNTTYEIQRDDAVEWVYMKLKDATLQSGLGHTVVMHELLGESKVELSLSAGNMSAVKKLSESQRKKLVCLLRLQIYDVQGALNCIEIPPFPSSPPPNSTTDGPGRSPPELPKKGESDKNSKTSPTMAKVLAHGLHEKKESEAHESEPVDPSISVARRMSVTSHDDDSGSDTDVLTVSSTNASVASVPSYEDSRPDPTCLLRHMSGISLVDDDIAIETKDEPCLNESSSAPLPEASEATPCTDEKSCVRFAREENSMDENSLFGVAPASSLYSDEKAQLLASLDLDETLVSGVDGDKIEFFGSLLPPTELSRSSSSSCSFTSRLLSMASPFRGRGSDFEQIF